MAHSFARIAGWFRSREGRQANITAFALGALLTLSFAPFWVLPTLIIALTGWVWLLEAAPTGKSAFARSWWFGFGHFITGLYWITIALSGDGGKHYWVMPFALFLLPAYVALYPGLAGYIFHKTRLRGVERLLLLGVLWGAGEYIRSFVMTGFSWNLLGYVWTATDATLQPASLVGIYGLSLWAVLLGMSFSLLDVKERGKGITPKTGLVSILLVSVVLTGWGWLRLKEATPTEPDLNLPLVRIVQANVPQGDKWDPKLQLASLEQHFELTHGISPASVQSPPPDYVVWPETAMPYPFITGSEWTQVLSEQVPDYGVLLTGVMRIEESTTEWKVWNSLQAVDGHGNLIGVYDKTKLVPFGEFIPLRWVFDKFAVNKVTHGSTDFMEGKGPVYLTLPGKAPLVQPLICYETVFPDYRPYPFAPHPDWLLNITNDAWFGRSIGPHQHLHMAQTRAVERGAPMVRAANSGISAAFNAYGQELGRIPLNTKGFLDINLPKKLVNPTWYARYGDFSFLLLSYGLLLLAFRLRV